MTDHITVESHEFYTYVRIGRTGAMLGTIMDPVTSVEREVLTLIDYTDELCPIRQTVDPGEHGVNFEELFHTLTILHAEISAATPTSAKQYVEERGMGARDEL